MVDAGGVADFVLHQLAGGEDVRDQAVAVEVVGAGLGDVGERLNRRGVEQGLRDHVAGEGRGGGGGRELVAADEVEIVVNGAVAGGDDGRRRDGFELIDHALGQPAGVRVDQAAEVAVAHAVGEEQAVLVEVIAAVLGFNGAEEEGLIFAVVDFGDVDGAAGGTGELVVFEGGDGAIGGGEREGRGGEGGVAVVPEERAAQTVGAGFGGDVDDAAAGGAVFGGKRRGLDGKLLDGFGRETGDGAAEADAGVVGAIGEDERAEGSAAADAQITAGARGGADQSGVLTAGVAADVGQGEGEVEHAAVDQRGVLNFARGDGGTEGAAFGVDGSGFGLHGDFGGERAGVEFDIDGDDAGGIHFHVVDGALAEAGGFDLDPVSHGLERGQDVAAGGGGFLVGFLVGAEVGDGDGGTGNDGSGGIENSAGDASPVSLSGESGAGEDGRENGETGGTGRRHGQFSLETLALGMVTQSEDSHKRRALFRLAKGEGGGFTAC